MGEQEKEKEKKSNQGVPLRKHKGKVKQLGHNSKKPRNVGQLAFDFKKTRK